ncbi:ATP-binding cassette domain-containing protein [Ruminococcus sp. AF31-8BH]|uniref:ATP-binding cassette domain-containing protein n=1 Tax=Ruminococcus sp. AF31-8BH TaxID=2293174 RepID=UPI00325A6645
MKQPEKNVLEVKNLSVSFHSTAGEVQAVRDVSFSLKKGEVLAIVGESGCGKSVLCKSIMKLLPGSAQIKSGKILLNGTDITDYKEKEMQKIRGSAFSMIFQDPMTSLNPTIKIGQQIAEAILVHHPKKSREEVYNRVIELMELGELSVQKNGTISIPGIFPAECAREALWPLPLRPIRISCLRMNLQQHWM